LISVHIFFTIYTSAFQKSEDDTIYWDYTLF